MVWTTRGWDDNNSDGMATCEEDPFLHAQGNNLEMNAFLWFSHSLPIGYYFVKFCSSKLYSSLFGQRIGFGKGQIGFHGYATQ